MRKLLIMTGLVAGAAFGGYSLLHPPQAAEAGLAPEGGITGKVVDSDGEPVRGARVNAIPVSTARGFLPALRVVRADIQGDFRVEHLPPGRYRLVAMPASAPTSPWAAPEFSGARPGRFLRIATSGLSAPAAVVTIVIGPGQELSGIRLLLPTGPTSAPRLSKLASARPPSPPLG